MSLFAYFLNLVCPVKKSYKSMSSLKLEKGAISNMAPTESTFCPDVLSS